MIQRIISISVIFLAQITQSQGFVFRAASEPIWGQSNIVGGVQPFLSITVSGAIGSSGAVIVYEYSDSNSVGCRDSNGVRIATVCTQDVIDQNPQCCSQSQLNLFIVSNQTDIKLPVPDQNRYAYIDNRIISFNQTSSNSSKSDIKTFQYTYEIQKIGYYMVMFSPIVDPDLSFDVNVQFQQPYGKLYGEKYPLLPFYGFLSLTYLLIAIFWLGMTAIHWSEILPVQNWIAGVLLTLMIDNSFYYGFYENWNANGTFSRGLLFMTSILNSARNAISLFCLLIVCLGYGISRPTLGSQMKKCIYMGVVLFICFLGFDIGAQFTERNSDNARLYLLFVILPLAISMTLVLSWINKGVNDTIKNLTERRQNYKLKKYRYLQYILISTTFLVFLFMIVSVQKLSNLISESWFASNWTSIWFYQEGWMNLIYFLSFSSVAFLWRPTKNNARYGLEELPDSNDAANELELSVAGSSSFQNNVQQRSNARNSQTNDVIFEIESDDEGTAKSETLSPKSNQSQTNRAGVFSIEEDQDSK